MNQYQILLIQNQRLLILQVLENAPAHTANEFLIQSYLIKNGLGIGFDDLKAQLTWLVNQDLINYTELNIKLKQKGLDTAQNLIKVAGIATPGIQ